MAYQQKRRGTNTFNEAELESCMKNTAPGSPDLAIMSFAGAFHGRLFGTLSTTRSKPIHKLDIPAFNWPEAPFPRLKYPLDDNMVDNAVEEDRCLAETKKIIKEWPVPIAAAVVEPIQSEGGVSCYDVIDRLNAFLIRR